MTPPPAQVGSGSGGSGSGSSEENRRLGRPTAGGLQSDPSRCLQTRVGVVFFSLIQYLHTRKRHSKLLYDGIIDNVQTEGKKDMKL
jgi:hypothetical protein